MSRQAPSKESLLLRILTAILPWFVILFAAFGLGSTGGPCRRDD
jgi:hypothetical protein